MALFFSRRTFNRQKDSFTDNFASVTRYVDVTRNRVARAAHLIDQADWVNRVTARANDGQVVFLVHGFNVSQRTMRKRMGILRNGLTAEGFDGAVVGYDWPADGNRFRYTGDRNDAKRSAPYLVLDGIAPFLNSGLKVHIVAHSMGCFLVLRSFGDVGDASGSTPWDVDELVFVAADVPQYQMANGVWGAAMTERRSKRLTNYCSRRDLVLDASAAFMNGTLRAGESGLPANTAPGFEDVDCEAVFDRNRANYANGLNKSHVFYFEEPLFHRDLMATLRGQLSGTQYRTRTQGPNGDLVLG